VFSRKSLRYAALGTGCTLTAVPRSTQPSTLRGTVNEYQPYGWAIIHGDGRIIIIIINHSIKSVSQSVNQWFFIAT